MNSTIEHTQFRCWAVNRHINNNIEVHKLSYCLKVVVCVPSHQSTSPFSSKQLSLFISLVCVLVLQWIFLKACLTFSQWYLMSYEDMKIIFISFTIHISNTCIFEICSEEDILVVCLFRMINVLKSNTNCSVKLVSSLGYWLYLPIW